MKKYIRIFYLKAYQKYYGHTFKMKKSYVK